MENLYGIIVMITLVLGLYELIKGYGRKGSKIRIGLILVFSTFLGITNLLFLDRIFIGIIWLVGGILWYRNLNKIR